jgi:hypothetical protein
MHSRAIELPKTVPLPAPVSTFDVDVCTVAYATQAIALVLDGDPVQARSMLDASLERADSIGHLNTRGTALLTCAIANYFLDDPESTMTLARKTLEAVESRGFHTYDSSARVFGGWGRVVGGDEADLDDVAAGVASAESSGSMGGHVQLYFAECDAHLAAGRFQEATGYLEAASNAIERTGEHAAFDPQVPMFQAAIGLASERASDDEIERLLDDSTRLWHVFGSKWMELRTALVRGRLALRSGNAANAQAQLQARCRHFESAPHAGRVAEARQLLAEL